MPVLPALPSMMMASPTRKPASYQDPVVRRIWSLPGSFAVTVMAVVTEVGVTATFSVSLPRPDSTSTASTPA